VGVVGEGEYAESNCGAGELARLSGEGAQWELLAELRRLFPEQSDQWFDGLGAEAPAAQAPAAPPVPPAAAEERPESPTAEYCLIPPNTVRWQGTTEVQPRLYHLLEALLHQATWPVPFDAVEDILDGTFKKVSNHISALSNALSKINFPWTFHTKSAHVTKD
jgi:hypothetical protein